MYWLKRQKSKGLFKKKITICCLKLQQGITADDSHALFFPETNLCLSLKYSNKPLEEGLNVPC